MSILDDLKVKIRKGIRKKAMRKAKFKRLMNESDLITIMELEESGKNIYFLKSISLKLFLYKIFQVLQVARMRVDIPADLPL